MKEMSDISEVSVEEILNADKENFTIPVSNITKVEMKKGGLLSPTTIRFHTPDKEYSFNLLEKQKFHEYAKMVQTIFPDRFSQK